jgi:hypothetical protein
MNITLLNEALKNLSNIPAKFPRIEIVTNDEGLKTEVYQLDDETFLLLSNYEDSYGTEVITSVQICERTVPKSYNYKPL